MKVYIGDREGEKARLLSLGVHPTMILSNGDLSYAGIPPQSMLSVAGLRLPTPKEAKYISSVLETIGYSYYVWARSSEGEWRIPSSRLDDDRIAFSGSSARLVLLEVE